MQLGLHLVANLQTSKNKVCDFSLTVFSFSEDFFQKVHSGWSPRGNQSWTALFHSFDVFQRWLREHDKHQRWSALGLQPDVISAEQRCSIVLTFFSADSENTINISADQLCFRADQLWFSLNQRCSELKNSALFQRETALNQRCSALIFFAL